METERIRNGRAALVGAAGLTLLLILGVDGWRTALLAVAAAGAIVATRVRFSAYGALALLVLAAISVITGPGVGG